MPFGTINGSVSTTFCLVVKGMSVSLPGTTGCLSRRYFTDTGRAFPGETCRNALEIQSRLYAIFPLGRDWSVEKVFEVWRPIGQWRRHDRQHHCACASAQCRRSKIDSEDQAIGRSEGGLSTKIHAMVDALGNPLAFFLTPAKPMISKAPTLAASDASRHSTRR